MIKASVILCGLLVLLGTSLPSVVADKADVNNIPYGKGLVEHPKAHQKTVVVGYL